MKKPFDRSLKQASFKRRRVYMFLSLEFLDYF